MGKQTKAKKRGAPAKDKDAEIYPDTFKPDPGRFARFADMKAALLPEEDPYPHIPTTQGVIDAKFSEMSRQYKEGLKDRELAIKHRRNQSSNAQKPRGKIEGESVKDIARNLAKLVDEQGDWVPAKELWPELIGELDRRQLAPEENKVRADQWSAKTAFVKYDFKDGRKRKSFRSFENDLSAWRSAK